MANHRFGLYRSYVTITLPAKSACSDSADNSADAGGHSCFKVQKSSRTARSRPRGLSFRDRGQVIFRGCAARAVFKVTSEKAPTDAWLISSNDVTTIYRQRVTRIAARTQACGHNLALFPNANTKCK